MKKMNKILSLLLALVMVMTTLPGTALAVVGSEGGLTELSVSAAERNEILTENMPTQATDSDSPVVITEIENPGVDLKNNTGAVESLELAGYEASEMVSIIVVMEDKALIDCGYSTAQIAANTGAVADRVASLRLSQEKLVEQISDIVTNGASIYGVDGSTSAVEVDYYYNVVFSGLALDVPYGALEEIKALDGVANAFVAPVFTVPEDMSSDTVSPYMYSTKELFGSAQTWEELGYSGEGMRIAILDTGLDTDHPSFADTPVLTETSLTVEEIGSVLTELNAYKSYYEAYGVELTAEDLYLSGKIPFAYSYGFTTLDVTHDYDSVGDHGTHVAGIAAANAVEGTDVVGVAPNAQVIVLKVFNESGSATSADIFAGIEDAFRLNVDVMNMSLGSDAGFSDVDELFEKIKQTDMIVSVSAGNSDSAADDNAYGTDRNLTSDPDNGMVGWPATVSGSTVVASMENASFMTNYFTVAGENHTYFDASLYYEDTVHLSFCLMATNEDGTDYEYVMVPGVGTAEDFAQVDVAGKIAVVSRGDIAFTEKQTNAYNAGAIACIVYNNVDGSSETIYMENAILLPNIFVYKSAGEALAAAADENGVGTLTVMPYEAVIAAPNSDAGLMSSFSSWGVTPDLKLVPDVTGLGGNIYSSVDGGYGTMSGTSMSAPHIAGMSALVLQYLRDQYDLAEAETHTVAEALIMSTATPLLETSGLPYSPRKQGAGAANVYNALTSEAYLTVNDGKPSVSLGDDDKRTGEYEFSFEINNMTDVAQTYALDASVLTDQVDLSYADYGYYFMGETSHVLPAQVEFYVKSSSNLMANYDVDGDNCLDVKDIIYLLNVVNGVSGMELTKAQEDAFDLNGDRKIDTADAQAMYEFLNSLSNDGLEGFVEVPANTSLTVYVTITLDEEAKEYMDTYYENGIYVEGFVRCFGLNGNVDLSLPYMGFYGDWSAAPVFDSGWYYEDEMEYNRYPNCLWTAFGGSDYLMGLNPYMNEAYDPSHNVLSPNNDGYQDYINEMYLSTMRNVKTMDITWSDEDGNVLFSRTADYVRKTFIYYGSPTCFIYSQYFYVVDENGDVMVDASGNTVADIYDMSTVANNDKITLTIDAWLDDGDNTVDESIVIPIVVDTEAPVIVEDSLEYIYDEKTDTRTLKFKVSDNYAIAAVASMTEVGDPIEYIAVDGNSGEITLDVSGYDSNFTIAVCDYGCNETWYEIEFKGEINADTDSFYGYVRYSVVPYGSYLYVTDGYNGWHSFSKDDASDTVMHTSMYNGETSVDAAEYVDGYIFGVDTEGQIFVMKAGDWTRIALGTMPEDDSGNIYPALDMAYDYTTDTMYILRDELYVGDGSGLLTLDIMTGEVTELGIVEMPEDCQALTLACDNDGVLYTICYDYGTGENGGDLYTIDVDGIYETEPDYWWQSPETYVPTKLVGKTGYVPAYVQSMTVDHETNELYWAAFQSVYSESSTFYKVDKKTAELTEVSEVMYSSELVALYKPYDCGKDIIPDAELEGIVLDQGFAVLAPNTGVALTATPYPFNADLGELTWSSSNEKVAVVMNGVVTAVAEGEATITVTSGTLSASCDIFVKSFDADLMVFNVYGSDCTWTAIDAAAPGAAANVDGSIVNYNGFTAAAYFNGAVYASDYYGDLYRLDPVTMNGTKVGNSGTTLIAMAFNYADGFMYGIEMGGDYWSITYYLVRINVNTGEVVKVAELPATENYENVYGTPIGGLAIDYKGNFYLASINSNTYSTELLKLTVNEQDELVIEASASLNGWDVYNYASLVYSDSNDGLFWANDTGNLLWIDPSDMDELTVVDLGTIGEYTGYYAMNMGLVEILAEEPELPEVAVETATMPASYLLLKGGSVSAGVSIKPWNAFPEVVYTIADKTVATVSQDGVISGLKVGETTLTVSVDGKVIGTSPVTVCESAGKLTGFIISDFAYGGNFWAEVGDTDPTNDILGTADFSDFAVFSGAYYDGYIYAYGQDQWGDLNYKCYVLKIDASDYSYEVLAKSHYTLRDMQFDYTTGNLYAIAAGGTVKGAVAQVDMETGDVTLVADTGITLAAMTIDAKGQMYAIGEDDNLYKVDKESGALTLVGSTGVDAGAVFQCLYYDHNTGNTYWTQVADDQTSGLKLVDLTTGHANDLGPISPYGAMVSALYVAPEHEATEPDMDTLKVVSVRLPEKNTVAVGKTIELTATVLAAVEMKTAEGGVQANAVTSPSIAEVDVDVKWTSSNEKVATVDENGVVTGIAEGTAVITASVDGKSASCTVTVTAEARKVYLYDQVNGQWVSVSGEGKWVVEVGTDYWGTTTYSDVYMSYVDVEHTDAEDESRLAAAYFTGEEIYAYDMNGYYYSIDEDSFVRTLVGKGISEMDAYTVEYEAYDWWFDETVIVSVDCELEIVDMAYDSETGKQYVLFYASNEDYWIEYSLIGEVDPTTGEVEIIFESDEIRAGNLLVKNGRAFMVDTMTSGMLSYVDLYSEEQTLVQQSLIQGYWGDALTGRSLYEDLLTGTVYAIRDKAEEMFDYTTYEYYYEAYKSEVCILNLADGDIQSYGRLCYRDTFETILGIGLFVD